MSQLINLEGFRFGSLTVLHRGSPKPKCRQAVWVCQCDCGGVVDVRASDLKLSRARSCGCLYNKRNSRHNMRGTPEYAIWCKIKSRCHNTNNRAYKDYGARGITLCDKWKHDFLAFYADVGPRPSVAHSIDREDNDKGYTPENCRWATKVEQARNKRTTVYVGGVKLKDIADSSEASYTTMHKRLMDGRPLDPEVASVCIKHTFLVNNKECVISDIAKMLGTGYDHVYHQLITKKIPVEELLCF